jgi:hypothetical protein
MTFSELLTCWRFEYWSATVAGYDATFYDFLLTRTTRFVLSAHGIGRNVEA